MHDSFPKVCSYTSHMWLPYDHSVWCNYLHSRKLKSIIINQPQKNISLNFWFCENIIHLIQWLLVCKVNSTIMCTFKCYTFMVYSIQCQWLLIYKVTEWNIFIVNNVQFQMLYFWVYFIQCQEWFVCKVTKKSIFIVNNVQFQMLYVWVYFIHYQWWLVCKVTESSILLIMCTFECYTFSQRPVSAAV